VVILTEHFFANEAPMQFAFPFKDKPLSRMRMTWVLRYAQMTKCLGEISGHALEQ
jgi:hypothetical protein